MNYKEINIFLGNAYDLIKSIPDNSIDLVVTGPYLYDKAGSGKNKFIGFEKEQKYIEVCKKRLDGIIKDEL